jgi:transposase-like protein
MVVCPNCSAEIATPDRSLKNQVFNIEEYTCKKCKYNFKLVTEFIFSTEILSIR